jgi:CBS domain-containing protein
MTPRVFQTRPEESMEEAARLMWEHDCGVLPVVDAQQHVIGMLTDRDVCMGAYTRGTTLRDGRVETAMSRGVFSCRPTDSLEDAIRTLADHRVRRVPVLDGQGKLLGIVSANDLFRKIVALQDERERARLTTRLVEAMASICEPRGTRTDEIEPFPPGRERAAETSGRKAAAAGRK